METEAREGGFFAEGKALNHCSIFGLKTKSLNVSEIKAAPQAMSNG